MPPELFRIGGLSTGITLNGPVSWIWYTFS